MNSSSTDYALKPFTCCLDAAREERQVQNLRDQRRRETVAALNQRGQTSHRLGGGNLTMEEVRRKQVAEAEAQLKRGNAKLPMSTTQ